MRTILGTSLAAALLTLFSASATAQHFDAGHSLEADQHDERAEGVQARAKASVRVRWQDPAARHDPTIAVKLLGINDFHGQLSLRAVGARSYSLMTTTVSRLRDRRHDAGAARR